MYFHKNKLVFSRLSCYYCYCVSTSALCRLVFCLQQLSTPLRLRCNLLKSSSVINSRQKASTSIIIKYTQYNHINVIIFIHLFGVNICLLFYSSFRLDSLLLLHTYASVWAPSIVCFHVVLHEKCSFVFIAVKA
jgi:hypothetical protein